MKQLYDGQTANAPSAEVYKHRRTRPMQGVTLIVSGSSPSGFSLYVESRAPDGTWVRVDGDPITATGHYQLLVGSATLRLDMEGLASGNVDAWIMAEDTELLA